MSCIARRHAVGPLMGGPQCRMLILKTMSSFSRYSKGVITLCVVSLAFWMFPRIFQWRFETRVKTQEKRKENTRKTQGKRKENARKTQEKRKKNVRKT